MFILMTFKMKLKLITICASRAPSPSANVGSANFVTTGKRLAAGTLVLRSSGAPPEVVTADELVEVDADGLAAGHAFYSPWFVGYCDDMRIATYLYDLSDEYRYADYGHKTTLQIPAGLSADWSDYYISNSALFDNIRCHSYTPRNGVYQRRAFTGSLTGRSPVLRTCDDNWLISESNDRRCADGDNGSALECSKLALVGWRDQSKTLDGSSYSSLVNSIIDVVISESAGVSYFTQGFDFDDSDAKYTGSGLFAALNDTHRAWFYDSCLRFESMSLLKKELAAAADVLRYRAPDLCPMVGLSVDKVDDATMDVGAVVAGVSYDCGADATSPHVVLKPYYMRTEATAGAEGHSYRYHDLDKDEMMKSSLSSKRYGLRGATDCAISHGFTSFCCVSVLDMLATMHSMRGNTYVYSQIDRSLMPISLRSLEDRLGGKCVSYTSSGYRDASSSQPDSLTTWLPVLDPGSSFFSEDLAVQKKRRLGLSSRFYASAREIFVKVNHIDSDYIGRAEYISLGSLIVATLTSPGVCLFGKTLSSQSQERAFFQTISGACTPSEAAVLSSFVISEKQIGWLNSQNQSSMAAVRVFSDLTKRFDAVRTGSQNVSSLKPWLTASFSSIPLAQEGGAMYRAIGWQVQGHEIGGILRAVPPSEDKNLRLSKLANVVKHTKGLPAAVGGYNRLLVSLAQSNFDEAVSRCLRLIIATRSSGEAIFQAQLGANRTSADGFANIGATLRAASRSMPISSYLEPLSLAAELVNSGAFVRSSTTGRLRRVGDLRLNHSLSSVLIRTALLIRLMMTNPSTESTVLRRLEGGGCIYYHQAYFSMGCDIEKIINSIIQSL